jgi:hypothetical protein
MDFCGVSDGQINIVSYGRSIATAFVIAIKLQLKYCPKNRWGMVLQGKN